MNTDKDLITTVVGSFPVKPSKQALSNAYQYNEDPFIESLEESVQAQSKAGIELISDGQTRNGMVEIYAQELRGYRIKEKVQIISDVEHIDTVTVKDQKKVKEIISDRDMGVKGIITGPWTMVKTSENNYYDSEKEATLATARALAHEANRLEEICDLVQVDEPFLSVEYPEFGKEAVETVLNEVKEVPTAMHVCGDLSNSADKLIEFDVDILDHEFSENPDLYDVYSDLDFDQRLAPGVVTTKPKLDPLRDIVNRIEKAVNEFGPKIMIDPDCGLRNLDEETARKKLVRMVKARNVVLDERS